MSKKLILLTLFVTSFSSSIFCVENSAKSALSTTVETLLSHGLNVKARADQAIKQTANSLGINPLVLSGVAHGVLATALVSKIDKAYPLSAIGFVFASQLLTHVLMALSSLGDSLYAANAYSLTPADAREAIEDAELLLTQSEELLKDATNS